MNTRVNSCNETQCFFADDCLLVKTGKELHGHGMLRAVALGQCGDEEYDQVLRFLNAEQERLLERQRQLATFCLASLGESVSKQQS